MPLGLRKLLQNGLHLRSKRQRSCGTSQEVDASALKVLVCLQIAAHCAQKIAPRRRLAHVRDRGRAVRIVKIQNGGLGEDVGCAHAARVLRIAFNLGGTIFMRLHQQRDRVSGKRHRRGVKHRLARNQLFRLADVRENLLQRLLGASGKSGKRHRSARQFEEAAARNRINPLGSVARKLTLQHLAEFLAVGELFQGAPILGAFGLGELLPHRLQFQLCRLDFAHRNQVRICIALFRHSLVYFRLPMARGTTRNVPDAAQVILLFQLVAEINLSKELLAVYDDRPLF